MRALLRWPVLLPPAATAILWLLGWIFPVADCEAGDWHCPASALSGGAAVFLFLQCLNAFAPGVHARARGVYAAMVLAAAPAFVRAGMACGSHLWRLSLVLMFLLAVAQCFNRRRALRWGWVAAAAAVALLYELGAYDWSFVRVWQAGFGAPGRVCGIDLPNLLCTLIYPLMHPAFCLLLPGLFLLFKKTDVRLPSRRFLLVAVLIYSGWSAGIAAPVMADLLPAYALWLLLMFPAWDRFFAYGFYFFPRLAWGLLCLMGILQIIFSGTGWGATIPK